MGELSVEQMEDTEGNYESWTTISNAGAELSNYTDRTGIIDEIVSRAIESRINGVIIDFNNIENNEGVERFLIELTPRLREIGILTGVHVRSGMNEQKIRYIVDVLARN